jgi:hypothetical protein
VYGVETIVNAIGVAQAYWLFDFKFLLDLESLVAISVLPTPGGMIMRYAPSPPTGGSQPSSSGRIRSAT